LLWFYDLADCRVVSRHSVTGYVNTAYCVTTVSSCRTWCFLIAISQ